METPASLLESVRYFSDLDRCEAYMRSLRWPTGTISCPECNSTNVGEIKTRGLLRCRECRRQIYTKRGTIFEDSPLPLGHWFVAIWAIANCKNGISSHELARTLDINQKSAWFMLHRIRKAMEIDDGGKFDGTTEADTTYVGGAAENMHKAKRERVIKGRGTVGKTPVHGVMQRGTGDDPSQVRAIVLSREDGETLIGEIRRRVAPGATVCTDEARASWASPERTDMAEKKPPGWSKFNALAKRLVEIPKEDVDAKITQDRRESTRRPRSK